MVRKESNQTKKLCWKSHVAAQILQFQHNRSLANPLVIVSLYLGNDILHFRNVSVNFFQNYFVIFFSFQHGIGKVEKNIFTAFLINVGINRDN